MHTKCLNICFMHMKYLNIRVNLWGGVMRCAQNIWIFSLLHTKHLHILIIWMLFRLCTLTIWRAPSVGFWACLCTGVTSNISNSHVTVSRCKTAISVEKTIQVKDSIPWVCCASGNVLNQLCISFHCISYTRLCLGLPYLQYQLVLSWFLDQPESHQLSLQKVLYWRTDGHQDP